MIQLLFGEVRMSGLSTTPVLVLIEAAGTRMLPIWISAGQAAAILGGLEADDPLRPSTHDLLLECLAALDGTVERVQIFEPDADGVFPALMVVSGEALSCRASDAVALALRTGAPIQCEPSVLDGHGVLPAADGHGGPHQEPNAAEVEEFLQFLDTVNPDDFGRDADTE